MHYIDAELAGHAHKLDMKLQKLCGSGFSLFAVRMLAKLHFDGMSWPATLCENKDTGYFDSLSILNAIIGTKNYYCLLWNFENGGIAWCSKNNSAWGFCIFLKEQKLFLFENPNRWVVFFNPFFLNPVTTSCVRVDLGPVARLYWLRLLFCHPAQHAVQYREKICVYTVRCWQLSQILRFVYWFWFSAGAGTWGNRGGDRYGRDGGPDPTASNWRSAAARDFTSNRSGFEQRGNSRGAGPIGAHLPSHSKFCGCFVMESLCRPRWTGIIYLANVS